MGWDVKPRWSKQGLWQFTFQGRKYRRKHLADAEDLLRRLKREAGIKKKQSAPTTVYGLATAYEEWRTDHERKNDQYQQYTQPFVVTYGKTSLADIDEDILYRYSRHLDETTHARTRNSNGRLAPSTKYARLAWAHALLKWGHERSYVPVKPLLPNVQQEPFNPKAMSDEELADLFGKLNRTSRRKRLIPLAKWCLATGCRIKEARYAEWSEIDMSARMWRIPKHKTSHRQTRPRPKVIPLNDAAFAILDKVPRHSDKWIFAELDGGRIGRNTLHQTFSDIGYPINRLRHTWCQRAANAGVPLDTVREIMGHSSEGMIRHYYKIADENLHAAANAMNDVLSKLPVLRQSAPESGDQDGEANLA